MLWNQARALSRASCICPSTLLSDFTYAFGIAAYVYLDPPLLDSGSRHFPSASNRDNRL